MVGCLICGFVWVDVLLVFSFIRFFNGITNVYGLLILGCFWGGWGDGCLLVVCCLCFVVVWFCLLVVLNLFGLVVVFVA